VTERELVLILQQKPSHRLHAAGVGNIIYFPLARLWDFHVSQQQRLGVLALEAHAKRGGERLEILFPADYAKAMGNAFATTAFGV
jgi:hypothetical protein